MTDISRSRAGFEAILNSLITFHSKQVICRLKTGVATPEALQDVPFEGVLVPLRSTGDIEVPTLDSIDNVGIRRLAAI
ncbi:hypothetical protein GJ744_005977 [Endocarpon pusillum]|uniref:Uncharacterized protein n=1 Tax=Endocarpon pusillum TaxID=364733 RepID=A0A8H7DWW9_9EURO|nr:hypothetical protein GJ744_005977 [Endocarpon pusillum]